MASLQTSLMFFSSPSLKRKNAINVSISRRMPLLVPNISSKNLVHETNGSNTDTNALEENVVTKITYDDDDDDDLHRHNYILNKSKATGIQLQLFTILEVVDDRVEMHHNIGKQRDNWNTLLLNSINMITLTATIMAGVAATSGGTVTPLLALKLSSALLFSAATGLLLVMNKIQPSQLAEEQRNATRLFKQLQYHIETTISLGNPTDEEDVKDAMNKVLALDKAYPLPLWGAMLDKFPEKFEPAVWWPSTQFQRKSKPQEGRAKSNKKMEEMNGWSEELEMELREVIQVAKRKDIEEYERLGSMVLTVNKVLAIAGPIFSGIAAIGSVFVANGSWEALVPLMAGSMAAAINTFEHGGQVGMVFEMYRNSAGFFKMLEASVESTLEEKDLERRENGELFEMKVAMELGRSGLQLRQLAGKSASYRMKGIDHNHIDEFASKIY